MGSGAYIRAEILRKTLSAQLSPTSMPLSDRAMKASCARMRSGSGNLSMGRWNTMRTPSRKPRNRIFMTDTSTRIGRAVPFMAVIPCGVTRAGGGARKTTSLSREWGIAKVFRPADLSVARLLGLNGTAPFFTLLGSIWFSALFEPDSLSLACLSRKSGCVMRRCQKSKR